MTEAELMTCVTDALEWGHWMWHHETDSRRSRPGLPDLIAAHPATGRILHLELKTAKGKVSGTQWEWLTALHAAHRGNPRALVGVLRPDRLSEVLRWIAARRDAPLPELPLT